MTDQAGARPSVALLGTGIMGAAMGRSMLRAGLPVRAWNRTPAKAKALEPDGAAVAETPAERRDSGGGLLSQFHRRARRQGRAARRRGSPGRGRPPGRRPRGRRAAELGHAADDMAATYFASFDGR
jgi:hypothetical protein